MGSRGPGIVLEDRHRGVRAAPRLAAGLGRETFPDPFPAASPGSPSGCRSLVGAAEAATGLWTRGRSC